MKRYSPLIHALLAMTPELIAAQRPQPKLLELPDTEGDAARIAKAEAKRQRKLAKRSILSGP